MILHYDFYKLLSHIKKPNIDIKFTNPLGLLHVDKWVAFAMELVRIQNSMKSRTNFGWVDRTGSIPSLLQHYIDPKHLIPIGTPKTFDFAEICLGRAQELLKTGKQITVMWSGGLDSTIVLFSFLNQLKHTDQLSILCTFESIIESGNIFDKYLNNSGIRIKFDQTRQECHLPYSYDHEDSTQLYVNGQCGDQLFGVKVNWWPYANDFDPWDNIKNKKFLDFLEPSIFLSERPIHTIRDLKWWLWFNFTWTSVAYENGIERPNHLCRRLVAFFDTPEFQRWAIHTPTWHQQHDQQRWPAKQALSQLLDYPYYIQNKSKTFSSTWIQNSKWLMMDTDFNNYYIN